MGASYLGIGLPRHERVDVVVGILLTSPIHAAWASYDGQYVFFPYVYFIAALSTISRIEVQGVLHVECCFTSDFLI